MQIWFNGEAREIGDELSVAEFLRELKMPPQRVAVELNLELVPRAQHESRRLAPGDRLEVVTLVGGG